jgi:transposase InsO family protein
MSRQAFKSQVTHRANQPGKLIHSNVGSYEVSSREGYKYYITFVNDFSKSTVVFPMKYKSDSFNCFKLFRASFEKSGKHSIQSLRTNNGGEYLSNEFSVYLSSSGIKHKPGPPHSPELNGVAERTNRTISNLIPCSLLQAGVPKSFWADALRHVFYSYNSVPCKTPSGFKSPASILNQPPVDPKYLHPFGCLAWYKFWKQTGRSLIRKPAHQCCCPICRMETVSASGIWRGAR